MAFEGFPRGLPDYLAALAANNEKAWFDTHRAEYDTLYVAPAKAFVAALAGPLGALSRDIHAEPRVNGSLMRINRDVRFSKDKRPYKTTLDLIFPENAGEKMDRHARQRRASGRTLRWARSRLLRRALQGLSPLARLARRRARLSAPLPVSGNHRI